MQSLNFNLEVARVKISFVDFGGERIALNTKRLLLITKQVLMLIASCNFPIQ
jgi:hypothetical protein